MSFFTKTLLVVGLSLAAVKVLSGGRLRELGHRLDRAVNVILVLLAVLYVGYAIVWLAR